MTSSAVCFYVVLIVHKRWAARPRSDDLSRPLRQNPSVRKEPPSDGGSGYADIWQASAGPHRDSIFQNCRGPSHVTGWTTASSYACWHRHATAVACADMILHQYHKSHLRCIDRSTVGFILLPQSLVGCRRQWCLMVRTDASSRSCSCF